MTHKVDNWTQEIQETEISELIDRVGFDLVVKVLRDHACKKVEIFQSSKDWIVQTWLRKYLNADKHLTEIVCYRH